MSRSEPLRCRAAWYAWLWLRAEPLGAVKGGQAGPAEAGRGRVETGGGRPGDGYAYGAS